MMRNKYYTEKKNPEKDIYRYSSRVLLKTEKDLFKKLNTYNQSIPRYYSYLSQFNEFNTAFFNGNCFAVNIAELIMDRLSLEGSIVHAGGSKTTDFYEGCIDMAYHRGIAQQVDDDDLMIIYIKQMVHILRTCGIIDSGHIPHAVIRKCSSRMELFSKMIQAFWNGTDWSSLFPSDPHAADRLKRYRQVMINILISHQTAVSIEQVANEFFIHTGFSRPNDLVMISFLDFYLFTWLKHFSIISYNNTVPEAPVTIKLTRDGAKILRLLA